MAALIQRILARLAHWQHRHPFRVLAVTLLTLLPMGYFSSQLTLKTAFSELLPDSKPSVIEARRTANRLAGVNTLTIAIESRDTALLRRFVDEVGPKLRALPPEIVAAVDDGPRLAQRFFEDNQALYASVEDLRGLHDDILARYDYEVGKATGLGLDLEEDEVPPEVTAQSVEARFRKQIDEAKAKSPGQDGYYIGEDGHLAAMLVRTPLGSTDPRVAELEATIVRLAEEGGYAKADPGFKLNFTGNIITSAEQQQAVVDDLIAVGSIGVLLILGVVYCFFLRLRVLLAMTITILVGCTWAFGAARLTVGYLNTATGFLASIIAGNGINFGIVFMARYLEERRGGEANAEQALHTAHQETWLGTLGAAGAAMVAYGSLSVTDFRGFKHFGVIAGTGMLLCWIATYTVLPAVLSALERLRPLNTAPGLAEKLRGLYGRPFAWLAHHAPRTIAITGVGLGLVSAILGVGYFRNDPMEYDLARIRNERLSPTSAGTLSVRVDKLVGRLGQDGRAILTDRVDQVEPLVQALTQRRDAAPADAKPFDRVVSIASLLPKDQDEKLALLADIEDRVQRGHKRGFISDSELAKIREHLPAKLQRIDADSLPELVARPFTEQDGTRGRVVYIVPTSGRSVYDAHYLLQWADSFREVRLPSGEIIRGTGDPVVFADMLLSIKHEAPKAILLSFLGTVAVIFITFRARGRAFGAMGILLLGMLWLLGFLAIRQLKLNFLNFVALPVSIGVGADYALNILGRHQSEGDANIDRIVVETGGAVVVCSLTTMLGDLALLTSINRAVQSYGLTAAVGEFATVFAGMLVLPAFLHWRVLRRARGARAPVTP